MLGALPLRNMSRLWGYVNSLELPVWFRPYGFKLYAYMFGCNLEEIEIQDLTVYRSLGDFFYRKLKPGARPVDDAVLVSGLCAIGCCYESLTNYLGQSSGWNDSPSGHYHGPAGGTSQRHHVLPRRLPWRRQTKPYQGGC